MGNTATNTQEAAQRAQHQTYHERSRQAVQLLGTGSSAISNLRQYLVAPTVSNADHHDAISRTLTIYREEGCRQIVKLMRKLSHALRPRFDDQRNEVELVGTIPIHRSAGVYNLCVTISLPNSLPLSFPKVCPVLYVKKQIRVPYDVLERLCVDGAARIRHPVVDSWNQHGHRSTLIDLIKRLCSVYSEPYLSESDESVPDQEMLGLAEAAAELGGSPTFHRRRASKPYFREEAKAQLPLSPTMGLPELGLPQLPMSSRDEVKRWLYERVGLPDYYEDFIFEGYDSVDKILNIADEQELVRIGVYLKEHRTKIMSEIKKEHAAAQIRKWLRGGGVACSKYLDCFVAHGYMSMCDIARITDNKELRRIGIEKHRHRAQLMAHIRRYNLLSHHNEIDSEDETEHEEINLRRCASRKLTFGGVIEIKQDDESDGDTAFEETESEELYPRRCEPRKVTFRVIKINKNRKETLCPADLVEDGEREVASQALARVPSSVLCPNFSDHYGRGDSRERPPSQRLFNQIDVRVVHGDGDAHDGRLHVIRLKANDTFWKLSTLLSRKAPELAPRSFVFEAGKHIIDEEKFDWKLWQAGLTHQKSTVRIV